MDSLLQYSELQERLSSQLSELNYTDDNNNDDFNPPKEDKYSLRPRSLRRVTEHAKEAQIAQSSRSNKSHKQKQKAAPLSKYRRKTANARERNRMKEINQAFETLRKVIPHMQAQQVPGANEKLTKITTLRLAMKYISTLSATLNGNSPSTSDNEFSMSFHSDYSDLDCFLLESDGESLPLSDHSGSILASPDFPEPSLSPVDFGDPVLPALFTEHALESTDFSDFLLT